MRRLVSIAATASLLAAGLAAALPGMTAAAATTSAAAPQITWGACPDPFLQQAHAQCGFLSVPLNYHRPHGTHIKIAVSRIRHTAKHAQGIILTNPGGPGGSGLNLNVFLISALQSEGFAAAAADYDWIGFDPRGAGASQPAISCLPNYFSANRPNYVPITKALLNTWLSRSKSYAHACASHSALQSRLLSRGHAGAPGGTRGPCSPSW
jgi:hypothetical protein